MTTIWNLFTKNSFRLLQNLMQKVLLYLFKTEELLNILQNRNQKEIGVLCTLHGTQILDWLKNPICKLSNNSYDVIKKLNYIAQNLDRLFETGFSGSDVIETLKKINEIDLLEYKTSKSLNQLGKALFQNEDFLKLSALFIWSNMVNKIGNLTKIPKKRLEIFVSCCP